MPTVDVAAEHDKLVACLEEMSRQREQAGLDGVAIYDGPPDRPATDEMGRVLPYIVVWGSAGQDVPYEERSVLHRSVTDVDWRPQLTLVAGLPYWVLSIVPLARDAIAAYETLSGAYLTEETGGPRIPVRDPDEADTPRWFVVLPLRALLAA